MVIFHSYVSLPEGTVFFLWFVGICWDCFPQIACAQKKSPVFRGFYPSLPSQFGSVWNYHIFYSGFYPSPDWYGRYGLKLTRLRIINVYKCSKILNIWHELCVCDRKKTDPQSCLLPIEVVAHFAQGVSSLGYFRERSTIWVFNKSCLTQTSGFAD